jgi:predicted extracellular nuclease
VPIASIQGDTVGDVCISSKLDGQAVNIEGIVTHRAFEYSDDFFFIQDAASAYSGIKVFAPDSAFVPDIGDRVRVSGYVTDEFRCAT